MKVGLIARSEDRGLGVMTWAFHRHMRPERTMVIAPTPNISKGFTQHPDRYQGGDVFWQSWDGGPLDETLTRRFLHGLDVVYSAETFYDPRLPEWAHDAGCATVLHVMPEFHDPARPSPTETWLPTAWRAVYFPDDTPIVPVPAEFAIRESRITNRPLRVLHVAGHRAMADRNGTLLFLQALRNIVEPIEATVVTQDQRLPTSRVSVYVKARRIFRHTDPLDDLYEWADVVVLPRRYGGLSLPAQESLAHGCVLVMPNVSPNAEAWPIVPVPASFNGTIRTSAGEIALAAVDPLCLARVINDLAADNGKVEAWRAQSVEWAKANSWDALRPVYEERLARAAALVG